MSIKFWDKKKKIKLDEKGDKPEKHIPLRKYTKGGKKSTVMGLISLLIIVLAVAISIALKGKAGVYVGLMVFVSLIVSASLSAAPVCPVYIGLQCFHNRVEPSSGRA